MLNAPAQRPSQTAIRRVGTLPVTSLRNGVGVDVVARLLTHRSSTTTSQTYVHLNVDDLRAELTRSGAWGKEDQS